MASSLNTSQPLQHGLNGNVDGELKSMPPEAQDAFLGRMAWLMKTHLVNRVDVYVMRYTRPIDKDETILEGDIIGYDGCRLCRSDNFSVSLAEAMRQARVHHVRLWWQLNLD